MRQSRITIHVNADIDLAALAACIRGLALLATALLSGCAASGLVLPALARIFGFPWLHVLVRLGRHHMDQRAHVPA